MSAYTSPILDRPGAVAMPSAAPAANPSAAPAANPGPEPAVPDAGVAWHYGDPVGEQRALVRGQAVVDLSHFGLVRVAGPDRLSWLHSITTQHLEHLAPRQSTELLVLSPHGHIEHAAGVVDDGLATWLFAEPGDAAGLAAWLDSMRFARRVEVADVSAEYAVLGEPVDAEGTEDEPVTWRDPWPHVADGGTRYGPAEADHPGAGRPWRLVAVPREDLERAVAAREAAGSRLAGTWASEALRIEAWRPRLSDTDHRSIPHELDWLRTAVHLAKGCYRGQETVARVHNLGRPPRRLVMLHLDGSGHVLPERGAVVTGPGARAVGAVTAVARHHELGPIALAVVKRSLPEDAALLVACEGDDVAAAQEIIVPAAGVSADRPPAPGPVARGLAPRGGAHPGLI